jgi:excinuclease ABC subunit B
LDSALAKNSVATHAQELEERKAAEEVNRYLTKPEIEKKIHQVRKAMEEAAKSLDFIEAAKYRDEIKSLKEQL